jgi:hypothetical protein
MWPSCWPFSASLDVLDGLVGRGHGDVPEIPQAAVGGRGHQRVQMRLAHRLESDTVAFEYSGLHMNHAPTLPEDWIYD